MKLKDGVFLHKSADGYMGVTQGKAAENFNGLIRNNKTANDIFEMLMTDTTEENITAALFEKYDAPKDTIAADVSRIIGEIRKAGLIDE